MKIKLCVDLKNMLLVARDVTMHVFDDTVITIYDGATLSISPSYIKEIKQGDGEPHPVQLTTGNYCFGGFSLDLNVNTLTHLNYSLKELFGLDHNENQNNDFNISSIELVVNEEEYRDILRYFVFNDNKVSRGDRVGVERSVIVEHAGIKFNIATWNTYNTFSQKEISLDTDMPKLMKFMSDIYEMIHDPKSPLFIVESGPYESNRDLCTHLSERCRDADEE